MLGEQTGVSDDPEQSLAGIDRHMGERQLLRRSERRYESDQDRSQKDKLNNHSPYSFTATARSCQSIGIRALQPESDFLCNPCAKRPELMIQTSGGKRPEIFSNNLGRYHGEATLQRGGPAGERLSRNGFGALRNFAFIPDQKSGRGRAPDRFPARLLPATLALAAGQTGRLHFALIRGGQFSRDQTARRRESFRRLDQSVRVGDSRLSGHRAPARAYSFARHRGLSLLGRHGIRRARIYRHHFSHANQKGTVSASPFHRTGGEARFGREPGDVHDPCGLKGRRFYRPGSAPVGRNNSGGLAPEPPGP